MFCKCSGGCGLHCGVPSTLSVQHVGGAGRPCSCRLFALEQLRSESQAALLDSQSHFTCSALLPNAASAGTGAQLALGTTLGHVCIVSQSKLLARRSLRLGEVLLHRWLAHAGHAVVGLCCTGARWHLCTPDVPVIMRQIYSPSLHLRRRVMHGR